MKDMHILCVRLGVEDMEQEDEIFSWDEEVLAHMEIDNILTEHKEAEICETKASDSKLGVGIDRGMDNGLANMTAYYQEGTWYLDRWVPGVRMIIQNDQECLDKCSTDVAILSGTNLTNIRIVQTQSWEQPRSGWDEFDELSILSKGWAETDRLREGRVLQRAEGGSRNGKRKRGAAGWWWPASRRSPGGTTSSTPRSRPSWPTRSGRKHLSHSSTLSIDNENRHYELWSSLNLVAFKDNQDQGGHERGGVQGHDAGALQVCGGEDGQERGGVQDGGDEQEGGGQPGVAADGCGERHGPGGGQGLLVVTGKRRGRPKKGIVPDGLVQLRIQNFVTKFDLGRGGCSIMGVGGLVRGV